VARVLVEVPLAHLDRPFDYLVDERDDADARPGVRVKVRFAGRQVGGFLLARVAESAHAGELGYLERVVSPEPVLTAEVADLARAVADRYAGTVADVLRLAVPPRHARAEKQPSPPTGEPTPEPGGEPAPEPGGEPTPEPGGEPAPVPAPWAQAYPAGPAFFKAIREGRPARASWQALPGEDWPVRLAEAAAAALAAGRGALMIVPDATDLARLDAALTAVLGADRHVTLAADLGPAERYRRFLSVLRGQQRVVIGTRAAAFAPVADLGLVALFDDGDDLLAEPRAPYPHVREVLMLRSVARSCPLLIAGFARTAEAQLLLDSGWAQPVVAPRPVLRARVPWIRAAGSDHVHGAGSAAAHARIPPVAFDAARAALAARAPVLIQVPRAGYLPGLACARCRRPARCRRCRGPLVSVGGPIGAMAGGPAGATSGGPTGASSGPGPRLAEPASGLLQCRWCGVNEGHFRCGACGSDRIRATTVGARRTADEIGRAFAGVPILNSSGAAGRPTVPDGPAIVVATPGAEPVAPTGYGAALLLDGRLLLGRPDLRAGEETLRRWMGAAALVRPRQQGGQVIVAADAELPTVQALIRWDPAGHAEAELAARRELGFPPAVAMASIDGSQTAIMDALDRLALPADAQVLGPVPLEDADSADGGLGADDAAEAIDESGALLLGLDPALPEGTRLRALVRAPLAQRKALSAALHVVAAGRSARKLGGGLRIKVDPAELI
jgi:primosomal protein N' (replication factor Y)